mgnify:CR=1 FL=1
MENVMNRNTSEKQEAVQTRKKRLPPPEWELAAQRLKSERVEERLRHMPGWKLLPGGRSRA